MQEVSLATCEAGETSTGVAWCGHRPHSLYHPRGPFQRAAALKVWGKCAEGSALNLDCLRADFLAKLRNRTRAEMSAIDECARRMPTETLGSCLGYRTLSQKKLYKAMEDHAYVYRSVYVEHLQGWLKHYPPSQLLVLPSEVLFGDASRAAAMSAFASFLGLPTRGPQVDQKVLSAPSPAATDGSPHENGRAYVVDEAPDDVAAPLRAWLCPRNRLLHRLLERHALTPTLGGVEGGPMPWLTAALAECDAATKGEGKGGARGGAKAPAKRRGAPHQQKHEQKPPQQYSTHRATRTSEDPDDPGGPDTNEPHFSDVQ